MSSFDFDELSVALSFAIAINNSISLPEKNPKSSTKINIDTVSSSIDTPKYSNSTINQSTITNKSDHEEKKITAEFTIVHNEHTIIVQTIFLKDCCWIWLSDPKDLRFGSVDVVMPSKYSPMPLTSPLLGGESDSSEIISIAQRISKKFNMQVFLSGSCRIEDPELLMYVQNQLLEILPSHFR